MTQAAGILNPAAAQPASAASRAEDKQRARAAVNLARLVPLAFQLGAALAAIWLLNIEDVRFRRLATWCFAGFIAHYFTPWRYKKHAFIAISLAGGFFVLCTLTGTMDSPARVYLFSGLTIVGAVALGMYFFWCFRLKVNYWIRVLMVVVVGALLAAARKFELAPNPFWHVVGAVFMFRLIVYAYDIKSAKKPESLADFMSYFYTLPVFYFVLFPVVDYTTFKKSYYADDIHVTAQRGVAWIVRGLVHLCLYRLIYHAVVIGPEDVDSFPTLLRYIFPAFWLYLRVSGWFHIIVGMLHLFGYKLPETNHKYFLASSFTDFWRRINIYWKDFMVKVFYYPAYFRLRKKNENLALIAATAFVFVSTTLLHSYQFFWTQNRFLLTTADLWFWGLLGLLVMVTVLWEVKRPRAKAQAKAKAGPARWLKTAASTAVVYITISLLWSMWSSHDPVEWINTLMYWK